MRFSTYCQRQLRIKKVRWAVFISLFASVAVAAFIALALVFHFRLASTSSVMIYILISLTPALVILGLLFGRYFVQWTRDERAKFDAIRNGLALIRSLRLRPQDRGTFDTIANYVASDGADHARTEDMVSLCNELIYGNLEFRSTVLRGGRGRGPGHGHGRHGRGPGHGPGHGHGHGRSPGRGPSVAGAPSDPGRTLRPSGAKPGPPSLRSTRSRHPPHSRPPPNRPPRRPDR